MSVRLKWLAAVLASAALVACVTIHVYFPEAAAERAADRFIQDVIGEGNSPGQSESPEPGGGAASSLGGFSISVGFVSAAHAQQPNIDIDSPQVNAIKERMAQRHREHLSSWLDAGAIGLTADGLITIRDRAAVPLGERRNLEQVVNLENADRNAVYREIAVANGRPEWESEIRETFARQWVSNAHSGWYYQDSQGNWRQK